MCYETTLTKSRKHLLHYTKATMAAGFAYQPYYHRTAFGFPNLYIIKMDAPDLIYPASWGFVPPWAVNAIDSFRKKYTTFNARSESILTSGMYRESAREKRCLILADGFFEPHHEKGTAQAYFCHIPTNAYEDGRDLFVYAGLYSEFGNAYSCTILTTEANKLFKYVHNKKKRMPLVLEDGLTEEWFNPLLKEGDIQELLRNGFTSKDFACYPVSQDFYKNRGAVTGAEILEPKGEVVTVEDL